MGALVGQDGPTLGVGEQRAVATDEGSADGLGLGGEQECVIGTSAGERPTCWWCDRRGGDWGKRRASTRAKRYNCRDDHWNVVNERRGHFGTASSRNSHGSDTSIR